MHKVRFKVHLVYYIYAIFADTSILIINITLCVCLVTSSETQIVTTPSRDLLIRSFVRGVYFNHSSLYCCCFWVIKLLEACLIVYVEIILSVMVDEHISTQRNVQSNKARCIQKLSFPPQDNYNFNFGVSFDILLLLSHHVFIVISDI